MKRLLPLIVICFLLLGCSDKLNLNECKKLDSEQKDSCLFMKIQEAINMEEYSNGKICELFDNTEYKSKCFMNFGMKWRNEVLCERATEDDKNFCLAMLRLDIAYCEEISSNNKKQDCLSKFEEEQLKHFDYQDNPVFEEFETEFGKLQTYKGPIVEGKQGYYYMVDYHARGKHFHEYIDQLSLNALHWITNNTEKDRKILAWWDYGHAIEGVTGREAVFYAPSERIHKEIYEKGGKASSYFSSEDDYSDGQALGEFARGLVSSGEAELKEYMEKNNIEHIMVAVFEKDKAHEIATAADIELDDYFYEDKEPKEEFLNNAVIFRMIFKKQLESFTIVYEDSFTRIYLLNP